MQWMRRPMFRRRIFGDLSEEIRQHFDEHVDALMAEGMEREKAERAAHPACHPASKRVER